VRALFDQWEMLGYLNRSLNANSQFSHDQEVTREPHPLASLDKSA
jgi:hypothetical protein